MRTIIGILLFTLSSVGLWEWVRRHTAIDVHFIPSLTVAAQTLMLFCAGLLNMLLPAAWVLILGGIGYLLFVTVKDRGLRWIGSYCTVGYLFAALTVAVLAVCVRGAQFFKYDNFSHWATVVKTMLRTDHFPNFQDSITFFQQYPLGTSVFIWFFARMTGPSESLQMLAQIWIMTTCILPVFSLTKKRRFAVLAVVFCFANLLLVYNITVTDLCVDTVLALVIGCTFLFIEQYCGRQKPFSKTNVWMAAMYLGWLIQIKNSAIFFAVIGTVWLLCTRPRKEMHRVLLPAVLPFFGWFAWQKHCEYVFSYAMTTKHAFSMMNFQSVFENKTPEIVQQITDAVVQYTFSNRDALYVLLLMLAVGAVIMLCCRKYTRVWAWMLAASVVLYLVYEAGMLGMYLFSMPTSEAIRLSSSDRYTKTVLTIVLYGAMALSVCMISEAECRKKAGWLSAALALGILPCTLVMLSFGKMIIATDCSNAKNDPDRMQAESWIADYRIPEGGNVCVLAPENDSYFWQMILRYLCYSPNVTQKNHVTDRNALDGITANYVLITEQDNPLIDEWISENWPDQAGRPVIRIK